MKLNRNTKHAVKPGDVLQFGGGELYTVQTVIPGARGTLRLTVSDARGRVIYGMPSYMFYGAEIIRR